MNRKIYRHYGAEHFDPTHKLCPGYMGKPEGFYACPRKTAADWVEYCRTYSIDKDTSVCFDFRLARRAKILRIRSVEDILPYLVRDDDYEEQKKEFSILFEYDATKCCHLDMNKIKSRFDGMEVYMTNNWSEMHNTDMFYQYDVDTLVVWNLDKIIEIPKTVSKKGGGV